MELVGALRSPVRDLGDLLGRWHALADCDRSAYANRSLSVGSGAGDVTVDGERVWVANPLHGTVAAVNARTNSIVRTIDVGGVPRSVAAFRGRVWVAISDAATPATVSTTRGISALPAATCRTGALRGRRAPRPPRGVGLASARRGPGLGDADRHRRSTIHSGGEDSAPDASGSRTSRAMTRWREPGSSTRPDAPRTPGCMPQTLRS